MSGQEASPAEVSNGKAAPQNKSAAVFNQARPVSSGAAAVQGEISDPTAFVDTRRIFGDAPEGASGKALPQGEDGLVGLAFIQDLAAFLAENYWPAGAHPLAENRGISTADLKRVNSKYGAHLDGFRISRDNPASGRQRILRHVLTPSMVKGLYSLYRDRFIEALAAEAASRRRDFGEAGRIAGTGKRTLNSVETAEMFRFYAGQARGLAGAVRAYFSAGDSARRVAACLAAEEKAAEVWRRFQEVGVKNPEARVRPGREYQSAVIRRDQERANLAAALRRGGNTRGLDADSLVFVALWLHRRAPDEALALQGAIPLLEDLAVRLEAEGALVRSAPFGGP
ncbi:MAG: hypothetical protein LBJ82_05140 [Deltaproteobacteria bacterium]|nr:hypothetical protein [Deltaproteobacteria bacterium]